VWRNFSPLNSTQTGSPAQTSYNSISTRVLPSEIQWLAHTANHPHYLVPALRMSANTLSLPLHAYMASTGILHFKHAYRFPQKCDFYSRLPSWRCFCIIWPPLPPHSNLLNSDVTSYVSHFFWYVCCQCKYSWIIYLKCKVLLLNFHQAYKWEVQWPSKQVRKLKQHVIPMAHSLCRCLCKFSPYLSNSLISPVQQTCS